jgi:hypothetical protein
MGANDSTQARLHLATADGPAVFYCPGCKRLHAIWFKHTPDNPNGPVWVWNGDTLNPTFNPSLRIFHSTAHPECHSVITNGIIAYCSDTEHALVNQSVLLPLDPLNQPLDEWDVILKNSFSGSV